jgi:hypothetical protein
MGQSVMYFRQNCWRCAAFIYLNTAVRTAPYPGIMKHATSRMVSSLQQSESWTLWAPFPHILLWVLFMGFCGSSADSEKNLFKLQFQGTAREMRLTSTEEIRDLFKKQLWRDTVLWAKLKEGWSPPAAS